MKDRRTLRSLAALLVLGCGAAGAPSRHELIDSRDIYDPRSLDPAISTDVPTGRAVGYLFDGLTRFTPDAKVEPALAERWDVSPDGLTYVFHLRRGVKFHDGSTLLARHVVASWNRALAPATKSGAASFRFPIKGAKEYNGGTGSGIPGVSARDDSTVVVTLSEPLAIFTKMLAMPVAAVVPDHPATNFGEHPIGTGPWKLVEWKHDDYLLFARNPDYYSGAPKSDSLRARIIAEPSTAVAEFESGNVDILQIPASEARESLEY
jgi:peptide/nickel transport system substrate-binding protein/oligopeptide transport system substrate-binding protein